MQALRSFILAIFFLSRISSRPWVLLLTSSSFSSIPVNLLTIYWWSSLCLFIISSQRHFQQNSGSTLLNVVSAKLCINSRRKKNLCYIRLYIGYEIELGNLRIKSLPATPTNFTLHLPCPLLVALTGSKGFNPLFDLLFVLCSGVFLVWEDDWQLHLTILHGLLAYRRIRFLLTKLEKY